MPEIKFIDSLYNHTTPQPSPGNNCAGRGPLDAETGFEVSPDFERFCQKLDIWLDYGARKAPKWWWGRTGLQP